MRCMSTQALISVPKTIKNHSVSASIWAVSWISFEIGPKTCQKLGFVPQTISCSYSFFLQNPIIFFLPGQSKITNTAHFQCFSLPMRGSLYSVAFEDLLIFYHVGSMLLWYCIPVFCLLYYCRLDFAYEGDLLLV